MSQDSIFEFAKAAEMFNLSELAEGYKIFLIKGNNAWMAHGDLNDVDHSFLVAAQDKPHAWGWVEFDFLAFADNTLASYEDLQDHIIENEVDQDHPQHCELQDYTDVGDYKYRIIKSWREVPLDEARVLLNSGTLNNTNLYI